MSKNPHKPSWNLWKYKAIWHITAREILMIINKIDGSKSRILQRLSESNLDGSNSDGLPNLYLNQGNKKDYLIWKQKQWMLLQRSWWKLIEYKNNRKSKDTNKDFLNLYFEYFPEYG